MRIGPFHVTEILGGVVASAVPGMLITPTPVFLGFIAFTSGMAVVRTLRWHLVRRNVIRSIATRDIFRLTASPHHRASWHGNSATFCVNPEGISWSLDEPERTYMLDGVFIEASLAQLERAYELNVSYPESEKGIINTIRALAQITNPKHEIPLDTIFDFEWEPPLPTPRRSS